MSPEDLKGYDVKAELLSLKYLLTEASVLGKNRNSKGLQLVLSKGAIKKATSKNAGNPATKSDAHFLTTRYSGVNISISKDTSWIPDLDELEIIEIDPKKTQQAESIHNPVLGDITITKHAMEKYLKVTGTKDFSKAWRLMTKRLARNDLEKVNLPINVKKHKEKKYIDAEEFIFKEPGTPIHFVMVQSKRTQKFDLVTIYKREEELPTHYGTA